MSAASPTCRPLADMSSFAMSPEVDGAGVRGEPAAEEKGRGRAATTCGWRTGRAGKKGKAPRPVVAPRIGPPRCRHQLVVMNISTSATMPAGGPRTAKKAGRGETAWNHRPGTNRRLAGTSRRRGAGGVLTGNIKPGLRSGVAPPPSPSPPPHAPGTRPGVVGHTSWCVSSDTAEWWTFDFIRSPGDGDADRAADGSPESTAPALGGRWRRGQRARDPRAAARPRPRHEDRETAFKG